jgi:arylsulfatase A
MGDRVVIGGKALPLDAGVHVPMLAWWKGTTPAATVCNDLIDFSDFLPTIVEAAGAKMPTDRPIDGRSFLARLKDEPYTPRDSIFVHYDKSPESSNPEFRRVRFAFDGRYKLYLDGRLFDVPSDFEEEHPLDLSAAAPKVRRAGEKLRSVLESMPPWQPDNSVFKGGLDAQTRERRQRMAVLRGNSN